MNSRTPDRNELGAFLKARRADLEPGNVGLPGGGAHRRVAGLRREEVAQLTAISTDYYTRLEQGRISASAGVLASLARVLRLDDDQRAYMYELAGIPTAATRSRRRAPQKAKPYLKRILDHIDAPAIVMTPTHDILAWNPLAAALMVEGPWKSWSSGYRGPDHLSIRRHPGSRWRRARRQLTGVPAAGRIEARWVSAAAVCF